MMVGREKFGALIRRQREAKEIRRCGDGQEDRGEPNLSVEDRA